MLFPLNRELVVLFGGRSSERRVSVASAQNVLQTARSANIAAHVTPWFLTMENHVVKCDADELLEHASPFQVDFVPARGTLLGPLASQLTTRPARDRVFFLALHGGEGEDGTLQSMLEAHAIDFTGSGSAASRRAFDKRLARAILAEQGVAVAHALEVPRDPRDAKAQLGAMLAQHGGLVLKPATDGSSVGLHFVQSQADLVNVLSSVTGDTAPDYLAEQLLQGTELTVGVLERPDGVVALPPSEVRLAAGRRFDFDGKYLGHGTTEITPAEISPELTRAAQAVALTAHRALGCAGYTRTDLICTSNEIYFLETNTLPGLTRASFIPQQLAAASIDFTTFLREQIARATAAQ